MKNNNNRMQKIEENIDFTFTIGLKNHNRWMKRILKVWKGVHFIMHMDPMRVRKNRVDTGRGVGRFGSVCDAMAAALQINMVGLHAFIPFEKITQCPNDYLKSNFGTLIYSKSFVSIHT